MSNPIQNPQPPVTRMLDLQDLRQVQDRNEQAVQMARQFESLLIEEVLKAARSAGNGWLGEDADDTSESVAQMGEQFLAQSLAAGGGFGLAKRFAPLFLDRLQDQPDAELTTR